MSRYLIILFVFFTQNAFSQQNYLTLADTLFFKKQFGKSLYYFQKTLSNISTSESANQCYINHRLATINYQLGNIDEAQIQLTQYIKQCKSDHNDLFNLAQILINQGAYDKAKKVLTVCRNSFEERSKVDLLLESCDSATVWQNYQEYLIDNQVGINSSFDDLAPQFIAGKLYFSSSRDGVLIKEKLNYNNQPALQLYYSEKKNNGWTSIKKLKSDIKEVSNIVFSSENSSVYLSVKNGKAEQIGIYKAVLRDNKLNDFEAFMYNSDSCSFAHASLSPNGNVIYFVSDMAGGYGGTDLYYCEKKNGKWSKPINMGPSINTSENELFPYLYDGYTMYFSSNGKVGMGGYDIYKVNLQENIVENLKYPINTSRDELNIFFETSQNGFISSNRKQGKGGFDIYSFRKR